MGPGIWGHKFTCTTLLIQQFVYMMPERALNLTIDSFLQLLWS